MIRDIVVYDHRILRLIAMRHRRKTTLSLNLRTVCILMRYVNCTYISRDSVAYDTRILNLRLIAMRHETERESGRKEKKVLTICMTSNMSRCRE